MSIQAVAIANLISFPEFRLQIGAHFLLDSVLSEPEKYQFASDFCDLLQKVPSRFWIPEFFETHNEFIKTTVFDQYLSRIAVENHFVTA